MKRKVKDEKEGELQEGGEDLMTQYNGSPSHTAVIT